MCCRSYLNRRVVWGINKRGKYPKAQTVNEPHCRRPINDGIFLAAEPSYRKSTKKARALVFLGTSFAEPTICSNLSVRNPVARLVGSAIAGVAENYLVISIEISTETNIADFVTIIYHYILRQALCINACGGTRLLLMLCLITVML